MDKTLKNNEVMVLRGAGLPDSLGFHLAAGEAMR
jgi:hypothetical protein